MTQLNIIDQLESQTGQAVDAAGAFANEDWTSEAEDAVRVLARRGDEFTTDDIWRLIEHTGLKTPEPRAMGAVMRSMARDGWIIPTDHTVKSLRRECHRRPLTVWRPAR